MDNSFLKMPNFWAPVIRLCFGIISFGLYVYYHEIYAIICNPGMYHSVEEVLEARECVVFAQFALTACFGYTFVIEPLLIVANRDRATAEHFERTPLIAMFTLAGFVAYLVAGSILIHRIGNISPSLQSGLLSFQLYKNDPLEKPVHYEGQRANLAGYYVTGLLFIITGLVYLGYFISTMYVRITSKHGLQGPPQPPINLSS